MRQILWCGILLVGFGAWGATTGANSSTATTGENSSTFSGKVKSYLLAPKGEVEGVILTDGTTVRLPAHLASLLVKAVKPGHPVTVTATGPVPDQTAQGRGVEASTITDETTHLSVKELPSPDASASRPAPAAPSATRRSVAGKIAQLIHTPKGEVDGALLTEGVQVRFAPRLGQELAAKHRENPTGTLTATGKSVKTDVGTVVDAETITYNGFAIPTTAR